MTRSKSHHQGPGSEPATQADILWLAEAVQFLIRRSNFTLRMQLQLTEASILAALQGQGGGEISPETQAKLTALSSAIDKQKQEIDDAIKAGTPGSSPPFPPGTA